MRTDIGRLPSRTTRLDLPLCKCPQSPLHSIGERFVHEISEVTPRAHVPMTGRSNFSQFLEVAVHKRRNFAQSLKVVGLFGASHEPDHPARIRLIQRPHLLFQRCIRSAPEPIATPEQPPKIGFQLSPWISGVPAWYRETGAPCLVELADGFISRLQTGQRNRLKSAIRRGVVDHVSGLHPRRPRVQLGVVPMCGLSNAPLPANMRRQPVHFTQVVGELLGAELRVAKIIRTNLVGLSQLIRNVVKQRPIYGLWTARNA